MFVLGISLTKYSTRTTPVYFFCGKFYMPYNAASIQLRYIRFDSLNVLHFLFLCLLAANEWTAIATKTLKNKIRILNIFICDFNMYIICVDSFLMQKRYIWVSNTNWKYRLDFLQEGYWKVDGVLIWIIVQLSVTQYMLTSLF